MSNIGSSALTTAKQHTQTGPRGILPLGGKQNRFDTGTMNLLDEARSVVENAVGQGQQLNPTIYQMLGLDPQYEDNSGDLQTAQSSLDAATKQWEQAKQTLSTLQAIPKGKRSPQQRKQLQQLKKSVPNLNTAVDQAKEAAARLTTMPKTITGFNRMDPNAIPKESPFSSQNPLNQAQAAESQRLNQYLQGGEVDPTLKHQYDAAEQSLRAKLAQRFGPDFENTSVGQMALQNFNRQKNEAFATWNQQQVENYQNLAFGGQANLQNLAAGQIGLMREPENAALTGGGAISNLAASRLAQQQTAQQWALGHAGVSTNVSGFGLSPGGGGGGGLGSLFAPTTTPSGQQGPSLAYQAGKGLYNWIAGPSAAAGAAGTEAGIGADVGSAITAGSGSDLAAIF